MTFEFFIPRWHPATLNQMKGHWSKGHRLKKADREIVECYSWIKKVPEANGKRRVDYEIILQPGQRSCDPDAHQKSLHDALKHAKMIVNDSRHYLEIMNPTYSRSENWGTIIRLTDL